MVDKALELVQDLGSDAERGRAIGVTEGTYRRWKNKKYGVPLRPRTLNPLRAFLRRRGALEDGMDPGASPGAGADPRAPGEGRLDLIRLLSDPATPPAELAEALIREAMRIAGKRP